MEIRKKLSVVVITILVVMCLNSHVIVAKYCGKNAENSQCGTYCPLNCDNVFLPPEPCIEICVVGVCRCKEGFVFQNKNNQGDCIPPEQCPNYPGSTPKN